MYSADKSDLVGAEFSVIVRVENRDVPIVREFDPSNPVVWKLGFQLGNIVQQHLRSFLVTIHKQDIFIFRKISNK